MQTGERLRIALQKSGRLAEGSVALLKKCGFSVNLNKKQLLVSDNAARTDFIFSRDDDIPGFLTDKICDLGIIGSNLLKEYSLSNGIESNAIEVIMSLGFSKCRLSLAIPKGSPFQSISDLEGTTIATSYPKTLAQFLKKNEITASIVTMHGSVELAPRIGIADLICDLVSSGATLQENGLQEMMKIMDSEAVLVANAGLNNRNKQQLTEKMVLRMKGILNADKNKYIMLHIDRSKVGKIREILPCNEAPTVLELQGIPDKVALHVVSPEDVFWETIEKLKAVGATSILVLPIGKMME